MKIGQAVYAKSGAGAAGDAGAAGAKPDEKEAEFKEEAAKDAKKP